MKQVLYLVNNLDDPAIVRRVRMLELGMSSPTIVGFRRGSGPLCELGRPPIVLGTTRDARLADRIVRVAASLTRVWRHRAAFRNAEAILARNLEMVILALFIRAIAARGARITYECLDIHRIQVDPGLRGQAFRSLEKRLVRRCDLIITSSPAFVREYFTPLLGKSARAILVENKVLPQPGFSPGARTNRPSGPPWVIGWFGALRCRRSFEILRSLSDALDGRLSVLTAGRPAQAVFPDFDALLATAPHFRHLGTYRNPEDLERLYSQVHFSWVIDFFEAGTNSRWLLPNRLYEGSLFGAVPIAYAGTETARYLAERGLGVALEDPLEPLLATFLSNLTPMRYDDLATAMWDVQREKWLYTRDECEALVRSL